MSPMVRLPRSMSKPLLDGVSPGVCRSFPRASLAGCASRRLGDAEMQAIREASPLPPFGHPINVTVNTLAPAATPGVNGQ